MLLALAFAQVIDFSHEDEITTSGPTFVKFFAPWCSHCKSLAPVFEELADAVDGRFVLAEVNCDEFDECAAYGARHFPTLAFYNYGEQVSQYDGTRTVDAMLAWLEEQLCVI